MKLKETRILFAVLILVFFGGFYFILDQINGVRNDLRNLQLSMDLLSKNGPTQTVTASVPLNPAPAPTQNSLPPQVNPQTPQAVSLIPTSIIFETNSSPTLSPQTLITVEVESAAKYSDGTVVLKIKAFTNSAQSYSALDVKSLFQIVNLSGDNNFPASVSSGFDSIPPQSSAEGTVTFKLVDPTSTDIILETGTPETAHFYEFNFSNNSYKETVIG
jgi:hypothetical protein